MFKLADGTMSTDYKVGDKFVVVGDHFRFEQGGVITLTEQDDTRNPFFENEVACSWELLAAYKPQFTKSDLKDGMVVTYRNGHKRVYVAGVIYGETNKRIFRGGRLSSYTNALLYYAPDCKELDIMKVEYMDKVLWEREEETPEQKEIKRLQGIIKEAQDALNVIDTGNK